MSWFTDILANGVDKIVDSVGNAIDKNITTDHERLKAHNELEKIKLEAAMSAARLESEVIAKAEDAVSARWTADMNADEPIAKKVRPYSLIYLLAVVTLLAVLDGNLIGFEVKEAYTSIFQALLMLVFGAYFGSRGLEKIAQIRAKR
jgi:hypothetical protein